MAKKKLTRLDFQTIVEKKAITIEQLIGKVKSGEFNENEWVFTLDEVVAISEFVAYGAWRNCLITVGLDTKSRKENCFNQVKKIITDAFAASSKG